MKSSRAFPAVLLLCAAAAMAEMRTFRNVKGDEIRAELIGATADKAELKREDGKSFSVPLASLSKEDRAFIEKWRAANQHLRFTMATTVKKSNTRVDKTASYDGKPLKGNDCWYAVSLQNKDAAAVTGLTMEYIVFAPQGAPVPSVCGVTPVASIAGGKTGVLSTAKLFVPQKSTGVSDGLSTTMIMSEGTLGGIYAEFLIDGKQLAGVKSGNPPEDAAAQLKAWREKQAAGAAPEK